MRFDQKRAKSSVAYEELHNGTEDSQNDKNTGKEIEKHHNTRI